MRYAHLQVDKAMDDMAEVMGLLIKNENESSDESEEKLI
jgi:hypothetical protein